MQYSLVESREQGGGCEWEYAVHGGGWQESYTHRVGMG
jgi:hypothetical protein